MTDGWSIRDIARLVAKQRDLKKEKDEAYQPEMDWGVKERQVYDYAHAAEEQIGKERAIRIQASYNVALSRYTKIFREAMKAKRYQDARLVQRDIDRLSGVADFIPGGGSVADERSKMRLPGGLMLEL